MRRGAVQTLSVMAALAAAGGLAACGSGQQQDVHEPSGNFPVQILTARFPAKQRLAQRTTLVLRIRNTGAKTIPNLAVTICNTTCAYPAPVGQGTSVQAFAYYLRMPNLAYHSRPVWVVDKPPGPCGYSCVNGGPGSYFTVSANTWAMNQPLQPGGTATFSWRVTAVNPGRYVVAWKVAAGIYGKAKAVLADGSMPQGIFTVRIARPPAQSYVNDNGTVVQTK